MLQNIDLNSLEKALIEEIKLSPEEATNGAKLLINELDTIFEKSLKDWSKKRKYTNVKVKKIDIFALMHYGELNYVQAIRLLNEYYLDRIPQKHLEIIENTKKEQRNDHFWKTLYLLMFS
jgi:hypothetical protein